MKVKLSIIILLALVCGFGSASAATINVPADYSTIQSAIGAAATVEQPGGSAPAPSVGTPDSSVNASLGEVEYYLPAMEMVLPSLFHRPLTYEPALSRPSWG